MIIFSSNTAWSIYNFRSGILRKLISMGIKVTVMAPHDETSEKLEAMGCSVIDLPMEQKGINPLSDIRVIWNIFRHFQRLNPEFVLLYTIKPNIYGSIAAALAGIPCIAVTTGLGYTFLTQNWIAKIARALYRFAFRFPREIWFLNDDDRTIFLQNGLVSADKSKVLNGEGVDMAYFSPQKNSSLGEKFRFLLIGRMMWDKGIGEFIEAARIVRARHPNTLFQLLGACDVPNPSMIERQQIDAWQKEGVIDYLGTTTDVRPFIAKANCVVLPSYREGIPRSIIEAASMCKPVIVSDAPGCREVVQNGKTGLICRVRDSSSLAACCERLLNMSPCEREELGQAGRHMVAQKFDEQIIIANYVDMLKRYGIAQFYEEKTK